jgi:glycosyltransferase involved in cell wall biosynthesis
MDKVIVDYKERINQIIDELPLPKLQMVLDYAKELKEKDITLSIVIPVYNEEGILHSSIVDLRERLKDLDIPYEIIIAENGSDDATLSIAEKLSDKYNEVRYLSVEGPNYGLALRRGMLESNGEFVICDEIDLCDTDFYARALRLLKEDKCDLVIGSKTLPGSKDRRPLFRRVGTLTINLLLRRLLGFKGTDTHGLKAFRRERLLDVINSCLVDKDLFASEFVIRAERANLRIIEIPVEVIEKRKPTINLIRRVPNVLKNIIKLFILFKIKA